MVEANLFARFVRVIQSYVSGFVGSYEDPERLLDRVIEEMQEDLVRMRQATAKVKGGESQMTAKYKSAQDAADEWLRRAELAVRKGQDELAREALSRRKTYQNTADSLKTQLDLQRKATDQLMGNVRMLESKLGEALSKRDTLKARAASAKASKQIQEFVGGLRVNTSTAWAAFDKMEEKVTAMEAEAESAGLLATPDGLEAKFMALEGGGAVEDELAALKKGMLSSTRKAELPAGRPIADVFASSRPRDALDLELDELRRMARS